MKQIEKPPIFLSLPHRVLRDSLVPREMLERMVLREMLVPADLLDPLVPLDLRFIYLYIKRT